MSQMDDHTVTFILIVAALAISVLFFGVWVWESFMVATCALAAIALVLMMIRHVCCGKKENL